MKRLIEKLKHLFKKGKKKVQYQECVFCKHEKQVPNYDYLEKQKNGTYILRHVWKCKECGKVIFPKTK